MELSHLGVGSNDEDSAYDSPRSTEHSLSPTTPPRLSRIPGLSCAHCGTTSSETRILPCLHSFCKTCLVVSKNKVTCPDCNCEFSHPPQTASASPDLTNGEQIVSINAKLSCSSCKSDASEAIGKCTNCDCFLCTNCLAVHSFPFGHNVIGLNKEKQVESLFKDRVVCPHHATESLKYFCYPCNDLLCEVCINENHNDTTHYFDDLTTAEKDLQIQMTDKINSVKFLTQEVSHCLKCNNQTIWTLQSQYKEITKKISQVYEHHSNQLLKYKEHQLALLEDLYHRMVSTVNEHSKMVEDTSQRLNGCVEIIADLMSQGSTARCFMYSKALEKEAATFSAMKPKLPVCNFRFESDGTDFYNSLSKNFGQIIYDLNGLTNESPDPLFGSGLVPLKYEKWSNSAFDTIKTLSDLTIEHTTHRPRSYHLKSSIARTTISYSWKFGTFGTAQGQFTEPNGVCINSAGDIIIADTNNNRVQVFDRSGKFKFSLGDGSSGNGALLFPNRVAVMEKTGDIVVTERAPTHQVQIYNQYGQFIRKFGANVLQHPRAVTVDKDGYIIVVECKVMKVIIFDMYGKVLKTFACIDTFHFPNGVAVNDKQEIFVSDNRTHCVFVYNYLGKYLRSIGQEGLTNYPIGVMLNRAGNVIVADNHNNFNLTVFTQEGEFVAGMESKAKHAQCYDAAISSEGTVVLSSKDYKVYVYNTSV